MTASPPLLKHHRDLAFTRLRVSTQVPHHTCLAAQCHELSHLRPQELPHVPLDLPAPLAGDLPAPLAANLPDGLFQLKGFCGLAPLAATAQNGSPYKKGARGDKGPRPLGVSASLEKAVRALSSRAASRCKLVKFTSNPRSPADAKAFNRNIVSTGRATNLWWPSCTIHCGKFRHK